jgi:hypothetical protein
VISFSIYDPGPDNEPDGKAAEMPMKASSTIEKEAASKRFPWSALPKYED